jgi:hypothetical protein
MSNHFKSKGLAVAIMLAVTPTAALANSDTHGPPAGHGHKPAAKAAPGPKASVPAKAKAYGFYCRGESKRHAAGQKGTPFSQCVTAMAKLATGKTDNPARACKGESHKHVAGQKGTPFSQCVRAAAQMKKDS